MGIRKVSICTAVVSAVIAIISLVYQINFVGRFDSNGAAIADNAVLRSLSYYGIYVGFAVLIISVIVCVVFSLKAKK